MANGNTLVVGFKETKDVLALIIGLGHLYQQAQEDGEIDWKDLGSVLPVLFLIGPAITGFENVQLELKMATKEEGDELKQWVNDQVDLEDKSVEEFVEAAFAVVLDIWMVFRTFFFPQDGQEALLKTIPKQPVEPQGEVPSDTPTDVKDNVVDTGEGTDVKVDSATPSAE